MASPAAVPTPHPAPRRSRLGAVAARRRNPLWRRNDTRRSRLTALVLLGVVATASMSALLALALFQGDRASVARYAAGLHRVEGVAVTDADQPQTGAGTAYLAEVRWTDPAGATHRAEAVVDATTTAGAKVTVWLDHADRPRTPPTGVVDSAGKAAFLGAVTLICAGAVVLGAGSAARTRLNRADLLEWDQEWELVEPAWTRRPH